MKIAVTGAFSYSGKYAAQRLLERGEQVITLTGHPNRPDPFDGKIKAYPLDFSNEDEFNQITQRRRCFGQHLLDTIRLQTKYSTARS